MRFARRWGSGRPDRNRGGWRVELRADVQGTPLAGFRPDPRRHRADLRRPRVPRKSAGRVRGHHPRLLPGLAARVHPHADRGSSGHRSVPVPGGGRDGRLHSAVRCARNPRRDRRRRSGEFDCRFHRERPDPAERPAIDRGAMANPAQRARLDRRQSDRAGEYLPRQPEPLCRGTRWAPPAGCRGEPGGDCQPAPDPDPVPVHGRGPGSSARLGVPAGAAAVQGSGARA